MKNKEKNSFLITCGTCIVVLLTLCYFGVNDSMKASYGATTCYCATGIVSGYSCIDETTGKLVGTPICQDDTVAPPSFDNSDSSGNNCDVKNGEYEAYGECMGAAGKGKTCEYSNGCYVIVDGDDGAGGDDGDETCYDWSTADMKGRVNCGIGKYTLSLENATCYRWSCTNKECPSGTYYSSVTASIAADMKCEFNKVYETADGCYAFECCDCEGESCDEEYTACWFTGNSYVWGSSSKYGENGRGYSKVSSSYCTGDDSTNPDDESPSNPSRPSTPSNPSNPSSPSRPSRPSTSSNPSSPSRPSYSSSPLSSLNRGPGCYKNKNTGVIKWFDVDPEKNGDGSLYVVVADSECEKNVTVNPSTGQIMVFVMWFVGISILGYSMWYFVKYKKLN